MAKRISRLATSRSAVTATGWLVPCETAKGSATRSGASSPLNVTGSAGSSADSATERAKGMFFSNSSVISRSSSGKLKPLTQSSATHGSSAYLFEATSQVVISGVKPSVPNSTVMWESVSPLVV